MESTLKVRSMLGISCGLLILLAGIFLPFSASAQDITVINHLFSPTHPDQGAWYNTTSPWIKWNTGRYVTPGSAYDVQVVGNHAYIADDLKGLQIMDVSDPMNPVIVGGKSVSQGVAIVAVSGNYAYISSAFGIFTMDISDPAAPTELSFYQTSNSVSAMVVSDGFLFVSHMYDGLLVFDISSPANPVLVSTYDPGGMPFDISVSGSFAYVADYYDGLMVIDISDPYNPMLVARGANQGLSRAVSVSGNHAYLTDSSAGLMVFDVTAASQPVLTGTVAVDTPESLDSDGSYVYSANSANGLDIIDVSDPANPYVIWHRDTSRHAMAVDIEGSNLFVAETLTGLEVYDVNGFPTDFSFCLDHDPDTIPDTISEGQKFSTSYTSLSDGEWFFHVRAKSHAGIWGAPAHYKLNIDTVDPSVSVIAPSDLAVPGPATVEVLFSDMKSGVDLNSVEVLFDYDYPVNGCSIGPDRAVCTVDVPDYRAHVVSAGLSDMAGNIGAASALIQAKPCPGLARPDLSLALDRAYWASLADYENGYLSVDYILSNGSDNTVYEMNVMGTINTNGASLYDWGYDQPNIPGGSSAVVTLDYLIAPGVASFKSRVFMSVEDECGDVHRYPGPWPGS